MAETKVYAIALDGGSEYEVTVAPGETEGEFNVTLDGRTYASVVRDVTPEPEPSEFGFALYHILIDVEKDNEKDICSKVFWLSE